MRIDAAREIVKEKLDAENEAQIRREWLVIKRRFKYRRMLQQDNGLGEGVSSWAKVLIQMRRRFKRAEYGLVPTVMLERRTLLEMLGEEGDVEESEDTETDLDEAEERERLAQLERQRIQEFEDEWDAQSRAMLEERISQRNAELEQEALEMDMEDDEEPESEGSEEDEEEELEE